MKRSQYAMLGAIGCLLFVFVWPNPFLVWLIMIGIGIHGSWLTDPPKGQMPENTTHTS